MLNLKGCEIMEKTPDLEKMAKETAERMDSPEVQELCAKIEEEQRQQDLKNPVTLLLKLYDKINDHPKINEIEMDLELCNDLQAVLAAMVGPTLAEELIGGDR